jgi:hypothetical protein
MRRRRMYQGRDYFKPGPDDSDSVRADRGAQSLAGLSKRGWDCGEGEMGSSRQGVVFTNNNQWSIREQGIDQERPSERRRC